MKYIILLASILLLSACNTAPPKPVMTEPIVHEVADIRLNLRYLDEDELIFLHDSNDVAGYKNPYYKYPTLITKKRLVVFEFTGSSTETTVLFKLKDINLSIDRIAGPAKSRPYLENIWGHIDKVNLPAMTRTMKQTLLDREFTIEPGKPVTGYLVFGENYPQGGGDGIITMYVSTSTGDDGTIEIPLKFSSDGTLQTSEKEPSIFSDTEK